MKRNRVKLLSYCKYLMMHSTDGGEVVEVPRCRGAEFVDSLSIYLHACVPHETLYTM